MKKILLSLLAITCCSLGFSDEPSENAKKHKKSASCASREATVASMMGWGIGLFAGIATLCALLQSNPEKTSSD